MVGKRIATSDLNHENWDKEEEPEEAGSFKVAPEEELKTRVIKTARRSIKTDSPENKNVFASFAAFKNDDTPEKTSPFSLLFKSSTDTSSSVIKEESLSTNNNKNGKNTEKCETLNTVLDNKTSDSDCSKNKTSDNDFEIRNFNKHFVSWLTDLFNRNPNHNLTTYLQQYEISMGNTFSTDQIKNFKYDIGKFEYQHKISKSPVNIEIVKDQENTSESKERPNMFSNINFSSLTNTSTTVPSGPLFNFSEFQSSNFGKRDLQLEKEDETHSNTPATEFEKVAEPNSLYSKRCKIFAKDDGEFCSRGVGTLYMRSVMNSEKTQLIVRADTIQGNILLNLILNEGLPCKRLGKNNVMVFCIPTPESEPTSILIRVKTEEDADELLETIKKYKK